MVCIGMLTRLMFEWKSSCPSLLCCGWHKCHNKKEHEEERVTSDLHLGKPRLELETEKMEGRCRLASSRLSYTAQGGAAHSGLGTCLSISNQANARQASSEASWMEATLQFRFPIPRRVKRLSS